MAPSAERGPDITARTSRVWLPARSRTTTSISDTPPSSGSSTAKAPSAATSAVTSLTVTDATPLPSSCARPPTATALEASCAARSGLLTVSSGGSRSSAPTETAQDSRAAAHRTGAVPEAELMASAGTTRAPAATTWRRAGFFAPCNAARDTRGPAPRRPAARADSRAICFSRGVQCLYK